MRSTDDQNVRLRQDKAGACQMSTTAPEQSVSSLIVVWILMLPLIYLASRGQFWFQAGDTVQGMLDLSGVSAVDQSGKNFLITASMSAIVLINCFLWIRQLRSTLQQASILIALAVWAIASCLWSQFPVVSLKNSIYFAINTIFALFLYRRFTQLQQMRLFYVLGWICLILSYALCLFFPRFGFD